MNTRRRVWVFLGVLCVTTVLMSGDLASAHTQTSNWQWKYQETGPGGKCHKQATDQWHEENYRGGLWLGGSEGWSWTFIPNQGAFDCGAPTYFWQDVRSEIKKWNGSNWVSCYVSPRFKARAWRVTQRIESASPNSAPCGNAYYTVQSEGGIDLNGDGLIDRRTWITIQQYSNANWYHWFPVAPTSTGGGGGGGGC